MSFGAKSFVSLCLLPLPLVYELPQQTLLPDFDSQIQVEWRVVVSSSLLGASKGARPVGVYNSEGCFIRCDLSIPMIAKMCNS